MPVKIPNPYLLFHQVRFILELENISNKLLVVPRPARVSALRAELTNLNHRLPAEVCLPLWCHTSDIPSTPGDKAKPHHRIVRIPPGEGVILNSAERTPYLLVVEVLHDDLDFETSKRHNVDILHKLISRDSEHTRLPDSSSVKTNNEKIQLISSGIGSLQDDIGLSHSTSLDVPGPEEEVDVVEQLYGPDSIKRDVDLALEGHIVVPLVPKNKRLDSEVWSKSLAAGFMQDFSENNVQAEPVPPSLDQPNGETNGPSPTAHNKALTLEDYSDRMQTAAVMLAQLNANVVFEPVTTLTPTGTPSVLADVNKNSQQPFLSWIPGSNWVGARSDSNTPQMRLRLQPAEAQAIRDRIMQEMLFLEEERVNRMTVEEKDWLTYVPDVARGSRTADESIIRKELNRVDPSAIAFREPWSVKKVR